jgi:hypothetical protein
MLHLQLLLWWLVVVKEHAPLLLPWALELNVARACRGPPLLLLLLLAADVGVCVCCCACIAACLAVAPELLPDVCH